MRRIFLLVGLLVLLGMGAMRLREDWRTFNATHQPSALRPKSETLPGIPGGYNPRPNIADWTAIPSHNPFSFDRTDVTLVAPADPPPPPKPVGPKPLLFGTMTLPAAGGKIDRLAIIGSGQAGANRNSRPVKVGEVVDGWTVVEIDENSVIVEGNAIRGTLVINDPSAQNQRDHSRTLTGSEPATVTRSVSAAPTAQSSLPGTSLPSGAAGSPAQTPSGQSSPDGSRVIQTPFGPVVRPKDPPQQ